MTLTQGHNRHIAKVKVTVYTWYFFFLTITMITFSRVTSMGLILNTIVVHDPGKVVAGGICPIRTCLVLGVKKNMSVSSDPIDPNFLLRP